MDGIFIGDLEKSVEMVLPLVDPSHPKVPESTGKVINFLLASLWNLLSKAVSDWSSENSLFMAVLQEMRTSTSDVLVRDEITCAIEPHLVRLK